MRDGRLVVKTPYPVSCDVDREKLRRVLAAHRCRLRTWREHEAEAMRQRFGAWTPAAGTDESLHEGGDRWHFPLSVPDSSDIAALTEAVYASGFIAGTDAQAPPGTPATSVILWVTVSTGDPPEGHDDHDPGDPVPAPGEPWAEDPNAWKGSEDLPW